MSGRAVAAARNDQEKLVTKIQEFYADPLGFVYFTFPWGQSGTPLWDQNGPDTWQIDVLQALGDAILAGKSVQDAVDESIRIAVASGHGIGKSALVAWIIIWFLSTRTAPQVVVTANTKIQLTTKTWRELSKWHKLAINTDWFQWTATKFYLKGRADDWFAAAIPWTAENSEAFAGTHEKHVLIIFDEASRIDDIIWTVAEGAMTTAGAMWIVFGNPTKNTGRFRECFGKFRKRWIQWQIDSRTSRIATNKKQIQDWIEDYGEDSDFVRVRVRGVFPRSGTNQLIDLYSVEQAQKRVASGWEGAARILACDPARQGDDRSVIIVRQGRKILSIREFRELDNVQLAYRVQEDIATWKPDAIFVDAVGIGAGVCDTLRHLGHADVMDVIGQERAMDERRYSNKRAENWWGLREWITKETGSLRIDAGDWIPIEGNEAAEVATVGHEDRGRLLAFLADDLVVVEYGYDQRDRVQIEKKEDIKARRDEHDSPDFGDALALTFAYPVAPKTVRSGSRLAEKLRQAMSGQGSSGRTHMSY